MESFKHDLLTEKIIGCCHDVHKLLGPVFIENIYAKALQYQLKIENFKFKF